MNLFSIPWLELAIIVPVLGALCVSRVSDAGRASRWCLLFSGTALVFAVLAWLGFYLHQVPAAGELLSVQPTYFGRRLFNLDELSAPLVPVVALLHFLTALATARTKMRRFRFAWSMTAEAVRLALFSCTMPALLIALLAAETVPPYVELRNRNPPNSAYPLHRRL